MPFHPTIKDAELNDFTLAVLRAQDKGEPTDIITPEHPIFELLAEGGNAGTEPPGRGPVEDIMFITPDRGIVLSKSVDFQQRVETPIDVSTQAQYDWVMALQYLNIGKFEKDNSGGALGLGHLISRKKKSIEIAEKNKLVDFLWNGHASGQENLFGLKDVIRFDATADPTRGSVGRLPIADFPAWTNKSANFNAAYKTMVGGGLTKTFIEDPDNVNTVSDLYFQVSDNSIQSEPDIWAVNQVMLKQIEDLNSMGLMVRDDQKTFQKGMTGFRYKNARVIRDDEIPDDPNTSTNGVGFFINTKSMRVVYADGLVKSWGDMITLVKTGFQWERVTQLSITYDDLRKLGVIYGTKIAAIS